MLTHTQGPAGPQRVVLLGAGGFVGRALQERLAASTVPVLALSRQTLDLGDATAGGRLQEIFQPGDSVVVAAALTPDRGKDFATLTKNLRVAEQICAALQPRSVAHLVYLSSDAVYGDAPSPLTEATSAAPTDLYGMMHRIRELAFAEACARCAVPLSVLRPCAIYGAGDTHNSYGPNRFWRSASAEHTIKLFGSGEDVRDHVYIGDVTDLIERVLRRRSTGILNLCSGWPLPFREVAAQVAGGIGGTVEVVPSPQLNPVTRRTFDPAAIAAAFPDFRPTPLTTGLKSLAAGR